MEIYGKNCEAQKKFINYSTKILDLRKNSTKKVQEKFFQNSGAQKKFQRYSGVEKNFKKNFGTQKKKGSCELEKKIG